MRRLSSWMQLAVSALRWRMWSQLGLPAKTLMALDDHLADLALKAVQGRRLAHLLATRAHVLGQLGQWPQARAQLLQLLVLDADNTAHTFNLGYVCSQMGDAQAAAQAFRACLERAPGMDQAWFGLGEALHVQGDWAGAEAAWIKQVSLQPLCPDGYVKLVGLFMQCEKHAAARLWLDRLREFEPRRALALEPVVNPSAAANSTLFVTKSA